MTSAKIVAAAAARARVRPRRGTLGSRIAIRRPSSCERCAIARLAPAITAGKRPALHDARDVEQLIGVVGAARARRQHEIVARALALGAQLARRHPRERIEPVRGAGELRDEVRQAVAALHVRELVQQHDADAMRRPGVGVGGHQHRRTEDAPRHRHRRRRGCAGNGRRQAKVRGERPRLRQPRRRGDRRRAARHPLDRKQPEQHAREDQRRASGPDHERDRPATRAARRTAQRPRARTRRVPMRGRRDFDSGG